MQAPESLPAPLSCYEGWQGAGMSSGLSCAMPSPWIRVGIRLFTWLTLTRTVVF